MKIEKAFKIDGQIVEYETEFCGFSIYRLDKQDNLIRFYFVNKHGSVNGYSEITSSGSKSEGNYSICDAEFKEIKI